MILGYEANIGLIYYGPKWSWAEMVMGRNGHGPKWLWAEMTRNPCQSHLGYGQLKHLDPRWDNSVPAFYFNRFVYGPELN